MTSETTRPIGGDYDAIVVGARAAGSATALLLARAGHRVLVVDRAARGSDTLSTHALLLAGVMQLERWGLLDSIVAAGTPVVPEAVFRYPDEDFTLSMATGSVGGVVAPKRTVLDPLLADAAESEGAHIADRTRVTSLLRDRSGAVTGIAGRDGDGRPFTASAPITIGADGARSFVARAVGAPILTAGHHATGVAYAYFGGIDTLGYEWCWAPGLAAGIIPTNDDQAVVFTSVPASQFRSAFAADVASGFHRVLDRVRPDVAARTRAATRLGPFRTFPGLRGHIRRSHGPGWALVGDAGYWKDPISAHGLTDALRDAELLAVAVDDALTGRATPHDALSGYQTLRDELSRPLFDIVDDLAALDWTIPRLQQLLVQLAAAMELEVRYLDSLSSAA